MTFPTAFLTWSVVCTLFFIFLLVHLWKFDRFKCITWGASGPGTFKRVMTYTYLLTLPCAMIYSFGMSYMTYKEGVMTLPTGQTIPVPYELYPTHFQNALLPILFCFTFAWALEMVTHLEELCFWLFLVNAGPRQPDWFHSKYFRGWVLGSLMALIYMPLSTALTRRQNAQRNEAVTFLCGSAGDTVITICFLPILWTFPTFLKKIRKEGVDMQVLIRLTKYYELNVVRILFRFMAALPLLILAVDALVGDKHVINASLFWSDLFLLLAAIGTATSSIITLFIFFPRSFEGEIRAKDSRASTTSAPVKPSCIVKSTSIQNRVNDTTPAISTRRGASRRVSYIPAVEIENTETQPDRRVSVATASSSASSFTGYSVDDYRYSYRMDNAGNQNDVEHQHDEEKNEEIEDSYDTNQVAPSRNEEMPQNNTNLRMPAVEYNYRYDEKGIADEDGYDEKAASPCRDDTSPRSRHNSTHQIQQSMAEAESDLNPIVHSFRGPLDVISSSTVKCQSAHAFDA